MPCTSTLQPGQTLAERTSQIDRALRRLEAALQTGAVKVRIGPTGGVAFAGWADRDGVSDVCAYRSLTAQSSGPLRMALARAEALAGRRVDPKAVAAGVHSHDGGHTWGRE